MAFKTIIKYFTVFFRNVNENHNKSYTLKRKLNAEKYNNLFNTLY